MKVSKAQAVLFLYSLLKDGKKVNMNEFCSEYVISIPTFKRYICEIRCFLSNAFMDEEIVYSQEDNSYSMVKAN